MEHASRMPRSANQANQIKFNYTQIRIIYFEFESNSKRFKKSSISQTQKNSNIIHIYNYSK